MIEHKKAKDTQLARSDVDSPSMRINVKTTLVLL